jgi:M6 family metalloprotease-like protein
MTKYFSLLAVLFCFLFNPIDSHAVSAFPDARSIKQPDGSTLTVRLHGDEWNNAVTTEDGYRIVRNKAGVYEYASQLKSGVLIPSGIKASNARIRNQYERDFLRGVTRYRHLSARQTKEKKRGSLLKSTAATDAFPTSGTPKNLLILANFSDTQTSYSQAQFNNLMNQPGYNGTGSFRDYYLENSNQLLDISTTVTVWVTVPHTHDYYGPQSKWGEFARDAVNAADEHVNFANFDNNLDGRVDNVTIIHQGPGQEVTANDLDIWSHSWTLSAAGYDNVVKDNVTVNRYTLQPEVFDQSNNMISIGVICHEFGHVLGAPDFYDTGEGVYKGNGKWDVMANGSYNGSPYGVSPAHHNPFVKAELDWLSITTISAPQSITLEPMLTTQQILRINTATVNEYFLLENKQLQGFDAALPGAGMLVYHVDGNYIDVHRETNDINVTAHQGMYPVAAGGVINASSCVFPGTNGVSSLTDDTDPAMLAWNGLTTNQSLTSIAQQGEAIVFDFMALQDGAVYRFDITQTLHDQNRLEWQLPAGDLPVLLAFSTTNQFGIPVDGASYQAGDVLPGGGEVLWVGNSELHAIHSGLLEKTNYYYKIWGNKGSSYSAGMSQQARTLAAPVSTFPWVEHFENDLYNWVQQQETDPFVDWTLNAGGGGYEEIYPTTSFDGTSNALFFYEYQNNPNSSWLISPLYQVKAGKGYRLNFYHAQKNWWGDQDELKVYYKHEGDVTWTLLSHYSQDVADWTQRRLNILPSGNFYLAFEAIGNYGYGVCLDQVVVDEFTALCEVEFVVSDGTNRLDGAEVTFNGEVKQTDVNGTVTFSNVNGGMEYPYQVIKSGFEAASGSLNINDHQQVNVDLMVSTDVLADENVDLKIYPNPAREVLYIQAAQASIMEGQFQLISLGGEIMCEGKLSAELTSLAIGNYQSGIYILKIHLGTETHYQKVIVRH